MYQTVELQISLHHHDHHDHDHHDHHSHHHHHHHDHHHHHHHHHLDELTNRFADAFNDMIHMLCMNL